MAVCPDTRVRSIRIYRSIWFAEDYMPTQKSLQLQQPEVHFDTGSHGDGFPVLHARFEFPLTDGFDRLVVQSEAEAVEHAHIAGFSVWANFHVQRYRSLIFGLPQIGRAHV